MEEKVTKETSRMDGNIKISYERVYNGGYLAFVRVFIQDVVEARTIGTGSYNRQMGNLSLNLSKAEALTATQRTDIATEFIGLVNAELEV